MFKTKYLLKKAKIFKKTIVFPEGDSPRVLSAVSKLVNKKIINAILIGDPVKIINLKPNLKNVTIIDPKTSQLKIELSNLLYEKRKAKGLTLQEANELILNPFYFSTMMLESDYADGMLGGVENSTADCLRPALQIIKGKKGISTISSCVMFVGTKKLNIGENNVLFTADCALNISPDPSQLCDIALATVDTARALTGIYPRVALLSFSTKGSGGKDEKVLRVQKASQLISKMSSGFAFDGELQLDAAIVPEVAKTKAPSSKLEGRANILIFPELQSGNIGYKLIERFSTLKAIGQITQGLKKPVNDMSRGCSVEDIVTMAAITAIQSTTKGE